MTPFLGKSLLEAHDTHQKIQAILSSKSADVSIQTKEVESLPHVNFQTFERAQTVSESGPEIMRAAAQPAKYAAGAVRSAERIPRPEYRQGSVTMRRWTWRRFAWVQRSDFS